MSFFVCLFCKKRIEGFVLSHKPLQMVLDVHICKKLSRRTTQLNKTNRLKTATASIICLESMSYGTYQFQYEVYYAMARHLYSRRPPIEYMRILILVLSSRHTCRVVSVFFVSFNLRRLPGRPTMGHAPLPIFSA